MEKGPCAFWGLSCLIDGGWFVGAADEVVLKLWSRLVGLLIEQRDNVRTHSITMQELIFCQRLIMANL